MRAYRLQDPFKMKEHVHDHVEFDYVERGSAKYEINGHVVVLRAGDLLILNANHPHFLEIIQQDSCLFSLEFDRSFSRRFLSQDFGENRFSFHIVRADPLFAASLKQIAAMVYDAVSSEQQACAEGYLLMLFERLHLQELSFRVRRYITEHAAEIQSLDALAKRFYVSKVHLQRLFRESTGDTVWHYISRVRIRNAAYLLRTTDMSVETVSETVGFASRQVFSATFRKYYGMSARQYRLTQL